MTMLFRLFLLTVTYNSLLIVYAENTTTSIEKTEVLPVFTTIATQQQDDKDAGSENQRQGRMSLHAELPASKAKREQALRNILAAKRRQVLGQRPSDQQRGVITPRLRGNFSKDVADVLEVQESRPGVYVATATGGKAKIVVDEETAEPLIKTFAKTSSDEEIMKISTESTEPIKQTVETRDLGYDDRTTTVGPETRHKSSFANARTAGYLATNRNNTQNSQRITTAKSTQINEPDSRRNNNNTVTMSESLYKHFRPVESNVPVEDMTQFLYFGQKLSPETQNTTSSNSLEVTPTLSPIVSSRRRFSMKRFSTTTPVPVPKLEEIINEEMNIAVERQTVERNKISKIKNAYRSPSASSLYYRKSPIRHVDPTIVSNVIGLADMKNVSEGDAISISKNDSHRGDMSANQSAHASFIDQVESDTMHGDLQSSDNATVGINSNQMSNDRGATVVETVNNEGNETRDENRGSINGHSFGYPLTNKTSFESSPEGEKVTTMRIVVAEEIVDAGKTRSKVTNDRVNLATPGGSPPVVVIPAQQHVYAYTITNVTRLLRNYSGPGVSSKEEGEQQQRQQQQRPAPPGTAEISDGIVATRSRSDLSAGPAAEGVTTLEGDQVDRGSGDYDPGSDRDAASRGATSIRTRLEVNKTTTVVKVADDSEVGESVRTDALSQSTGNLLKKIDKNHPQDFGEVDQRMLQKSASAVLNQRPGNEPGIGGNRGVGKVARRRDQTSRRHQLGVFKNQGDESVVRQFMSNDEPYKSSGVGSSSTEPSNESLRSGQSTDNVKRDNTSLRNPEDPKGVNGMRSLEETSRQISPDMLTAEEPMIVSGGNRQVLKNSQNFENTMSPLEATTFRRGDDENREEFKSDKPEGWSVTTKVEIGSESSDIVAGAILSDDDRDKVVSDGSVEAKSLTIDRELETAATSSPKETLTVQSTMPSSLFPVTPKIMVNANKPFDEEVNTVTGDDYFITEVPSIRTTNVTEAERPFGIAEDLSPSEIQQMYRSSNTVKPADVVTTVKPEVEITTKQLQNDEGEGDSMIAAAPAAAAKLNASLSDDDNNSNGQRTVSIERSPEVRGRNLSDKTRDKDDILPIMHLYNTTSIFNETSSSIATSPSSHGTENEHVILPVVNKNEESSEKGLVDSVTATSSTASSAIADEKAEAVIQSNADHRSGHNPGSRLLPHSGLNKPDDSTLVNEDVPVKHSFFNKTNNFTTGAAAAANNRTRHKNLQQNSTTQKSNNVSNAFYPTTNASEFGSSLLSPRLRDTLNIEVVSKRPEGDNIATQETVAVVSYILATLVVFPIAVGVGLILRRLIIRNRKMLEESDTSSEISCRKDGLNLENGDFKTSIEKAITKLPRIQHLCHEAEKPPPTTCNQESRWEFPRDKLRLQTVLGQGNFGQVWKAEADNLTGHQGTTRLVAVKTVKEGASSREKEDLVRELEIMQQLGSHPNVVTLLGCCTDEEPHYLILEYVMYGKLLAYLRDHRTRQDFYNFSEDSAALTSRDLTVFGYCVARGMEYLAAKKIIHRDLAARNVLVDHNKLCKIADFGMSRFANEDGEVIETRHGRNALPIRWMAPESLIYSLFTTKTDVWSFGILMWEIVTLGSTPYPDMTAREVMRNVQSGYRLERPSHCRSELFRVISRCWHADPDRRPEFQVLRRDLAQLLEDNMNGHYVDLESFASECTD